MDWLTHVLGLDDGTGPWYLFWSGVGADLGELAIVGGLISIYRRHQCHVKPCIRIGRHKMDGTDWVVCARHHPTGAPTVADLRA